jgi:hypothetical protein
MNRRLETQASRKRGREIEEERAAIIEHDGGASRARAKALVPARFGDPAR